MKMNMFSFVLSYKGLLFCQVISFWCTSKAVRLVSVLYKDKLSMGAILGQFHKRSNWRTQGIIWGKVGKERFKKKKKDSINTTERNKKINKITECLLCFLPEMAMNSKSGNQVVLGYI